MATLSPRDAARWKQVGRRIAVAIEPRLGREVIANRTFAEASNSSSLGRALGRARRKAAALSGRSEVVISTDVRSFYPSVSPSAAFAVLQRIEVDPALAREAATMLDAWGSEGYAGLPIGPPASAIVANAFLAPVDSDLEGFGFLRWVDDYLIGLRTPTQVPQLLDRIDSSFERWGLERSEAKTRVMPGGSPFRWLGTY